MKHAAIVTLLSLASLSLGCASSSAKDSPGTSGSAGSFGNGNGNTTGAAGSVGTAGATGAAGGPGLPPEMELESSYEVPVATGHFIWVANPLSGRVAYVDAASLQVGTVEAGNAPTTLAPIPGADDAVIVLNALSDDATVLRIAAQDGAGAGAGALSRTQIGGLAHGANAVTVSGDGRWAIAWTDARRVTGVTPLQGFQDVTVIDLRTPQPAKPKVILSVGFRPSAVSVSADGARAFAITADGITIIDLAAAAGPAVAKNVPVVDQSAGDAAPDISITPDGRLAVVRRDGRASFGIVDLATGDELTVPTASAVTDVDLTDDGARVVAVARDAAEVTVLTLGGSGMPSPSAATRLIVQGETIGSVVLAPGGGTALLYSNAAAIERLTVLTLGAVPSYRIVRLHAPVLSAFASAGGKSAVVFHAAAPVPAGADGGAGDGGGVDGGVTGALVAANAFSLVPLDADLPARIAPTDARPQSVVISPGADRVLVTVRDDASKVYGVYLGLSPSLEVQHFPLASPPLAVGIVAAAGSGYVAQKHPEGRITFVTLETGEAKTLTGFELGARVVDWSVGR